ncbi:MAG: hypothetical protein LBB60_01950 [Desulfovibrio sp.]|jgi:hypothetical protein|nr:hypothetical protein [Desulfovibrio sp.]
MSGSSAKPAAVRLLLDEILAALDYHSEDENFEEEHSDNDKSDTVAETNSAKENACQNPFCALRPYVALNNILET